MVSSGAPSAMSTSPRALGRRSPDASRACNRSSSSRGNAPDRSGVSPGGTSARSLSIADVPAVTPAPRRRSTTASPRPARTTGRWGARPARRARGRAGSGTGRSTRHAHRSGTTGGGPRGSRSAGTPRSPGGCAAERLGGRTSGADRPGWGWSSLPRSGQGAVEPGAQGRLRRRTGLAGEHLAVPQDHEGRDGADLEPLREPGRGVDVHLDQLDLAPAVSGEALQRGADHAAGPAPGRPHVDQRRYGRALGDVGEVVVTGVGEPRESLVADTANRDGIGFGGHAVALAAV